SASQSSQKVNHRCRNPAQLVKWALLLFSVGDSQSAATLAGKLVQTSRGVKKQQMCDQQLKEHSHGRIADPRLQQMKQHHQNPGHHRHRDQRIRHNSDGSESHDLSSDTSSNYVDPYSVKKSRHSRSCTDISRKHKYSEEGDDTAPLIDQNSCPNRLPDKEDQRKAKSHGGSPQGTLKNTKKIARGSGKNGSFRKAKSMEALSRPKERDWPTDEDESGEEKKKGEAVTNVMKEKKKFSAFLNEITRQVLSPMRLTTLGVTDAQRASVGSTRSTGRTEKTRQQKESSPAGAPTPPNHPIPNPSTMAIELQTLSITRTEALLRKAA
ncbi:hypothetical protein D4764_14G0009950, partial [Takifugu flavidus]